MPSKAALGVDVFSDLLGTGADLYNEAENRKLTRRQLQQQEKDAKFRRLLMLMQGSQGSQDRLAGSQRLLSLRNSGMA